MFKRIVITFIFVVSTAVNVFAADKVPREDFIKYTDSCIDVMDELEVAYSKFEITKYESTKLNDKFDLCVKKYSRYGDYMKWDEDSYQYKIVGSLNFVKIRIAMGMMEAELGRFDKKKLLLTIKSRNDEVKDNILKYRDIKSTKTKRK
jgi:hypothetical protein